MTLENMNKKRYLASFQEELCYLLGKIEDINYANIKKLISHVNVAS